MINPKGAIQCNVKGNQEAYQQGDHLGDWEGDLKGMYKVTHYLTYWLTCKGDSQVILHGDLKCYPQGASQDDLSTLWQSINFSPLSAKYFKCIV